ncbi:MAG: carboxypeptidase-like regulatory domain-containing protein [Cyclobacteriaceae bacterium]
MKKKAIEISVPSPCNKQWDSLSHIGAIGYCKKCMSNVMDFTSFSDEQIFQYFKKANGKTCGRFTRGQMKTYREISPAKSNKNFSLFKAGLVGVMLTMMNKPVAGQHKDKVEASTEIINSDSVINNNTFTDKTFYQVRGKVVYEDGSPLPYVNVVLKGTTIGTITDKNGMFEFPEKLNVGSLLVFNFLGMDTKEFLIKHQMKSEIIEVKMKAYEYDFMGEVAIREVYSESGTWIERVWHRVRASL